MIAGDGADDGDGEAARITGTESNGMFRRMDRNGDGFLSMEEIDAALEEAGIKLSGEELRETFAKMDTNRDGKVDVIEFQRAIGLPSSEVVDATSQWLTCIGAVDVVAGRLPANLLNGAKGLEWGKTVEEIRAALGGLELELAKTIHNGMEGLRREEDAAKSAEAANS